MYHQLYAHDKDLMQVTRMDNSSLAEVAIWNDERQAMIVYNFQGECSLLKAVPTNRLSKLCRATVCDMVYADEENFRIQDRSSYAMVSHPNLPLKWERIYA